MKRRTVLTGVLATLLAGCSGAAAPTAPSSPTNTTAQSADPPGSVRPTSSATHSESPGTSSAPTPIDCATRIVDEMSTAERAGQVVMVGVTSASASELAVLRKLKIGSVILMGSHSDGVAGVRRVTKRLAIGGLRTPLLISVDQEGGLVQRLKGSGFDTIPSAQVQSGWSDATLTARAERWGRQLHSAGVHWTLAPVADTVPKSMVRKNAPIGALKRGYGSDPDVVAAKVTAFIKGMEAAGVATTAKHFAGIGRVVGNTDFAAGVKDTVTRADDPYFQPFRAAVGAGVPSLMVSTVTYTRIDARHPAVFSPTVIGLIRGRLGFDGVVISDDLGAARSMAAVPAKQRGIGFLKAGGDLAMTVTPSLAEAFVSGVRSAAKDAAVAERLRASAIRVVAMKIRLGLVPCQ
ncbi:MAG: glycoside hydrolase family 3 N-terminal domain-containing protein [Micropruina sp.]|uniref:glycoside hydrolase family 3 N-terminal domain-containing protein n=1 Tax=Micropruina sp. TaxID=2737536 RepID=UPI0039E478BE